MSAPEGWHARPTIRRVVGIPLGSPVEQAPVESGAVDLWGALAQGLHRNARFVAVMGFVLGLVIAAACLNRLVLSA